MKANQMKEALLIGQYDSQIASCICDKSIIKEKKRYSELIDKAVQAFGDEKEYHIFSAPGRSEVGGNHTDHQRGRVLAASVNMDMAAVVCENEEEVVFISEGFTIQPVSLSDLTPQEKEKNTSEALIRGMLARFKELGYTIGGFKAYCNSGVLPGSGISSSAAFEVLIGTILSHLYNEGKVDSIEVAKIGQYAENVYFGKPCGLLDQMACSVGGFVTIDFKEASNPRVERVNFDFASSPYALCLVDTKGDHADLSDEYGLMPKEMKDVAHFFHAEVMSEVTMKEFLSHIKELREVVSDRAILRAYHFLNETNRVLDEVKALKEENMDEFLKLVIDSGRSSYMYLQNVYAGTQQQELAIALAVSEELLSGKGAWRVHGGGLAGTIQAFVPKNELDHYKKQMESIFGEGSCYVLSIRPVGGIKIV